MLDDKEMEAVERQLLAVLQVVRTRLLGLHAGHGGVLVLDELHPRMARVQRHQCLGEIVLQAAQGSHISCQ